MSLDLLIAIVGGGVTVLVGIAMILITPYGAVDVNEEGEPAEGSNLSPTVPADSPPAVNGTTTTTRH